MSNIVCTNCGFDRHLENPAYCQNCGLELNGNYCPNEYCNFNNGESISLPLDACYCPDCGSKSTFFTEGIIKPYPSKKA